MCTVAVVYEEKSIFYCTNFVKEIVFLPKYLAPKRIRLFLLQTFEKTLDFSSAFSTLTVIFAKICHNRLLDVIVDVMSKITTAIFFHNNGRITTNPNLR
jgi:hypothetical protein